MSPKSDIPNANLPELVDVLSGRLTKLKLNKGETLFEQGDFDDQLYVLDSGLLEVSVYSASGRKLSLNQMGPESVFGEIAIFDPGPRTARIEALEPCVLRAIGQKAILEEMASQPGLSRMFLRLAGQRMRWMNKQVQEQVFLTPAARMASKLIHLIGDEDAVSMSQSDLADFVGVTREVVSKTLSLWKREGIVEVSRGRIAVLDREALTKLREIDFV